MYKKVSNILCVAAFIGAMSLNSHTALAQAPVPTLDRVKTEQTTFLKGTHQSYALTELIGDATAPDGAITVKIGDTSYYYTPSDNAEVLQSLASTGSVALEVTDDPSKALYSVGDTYYTYNYDKLKDSSYNLTEAASADEPNTITLYDKTEVIKYYDPTTGAEIAAGDRVEGVEYKEASTIETTPKYYTVNLNKTQYGNPNGSTTLTYGWEKNADTGNLEFKQDPTTHVGQTITYSYSENSFSDTITDTIDNGTVPDPSGTSYSNPYIFNGGAGLNNPEGSTDSIDNILYKDNKVTGTLESTTNSSKYAQVSGGAVYNAGELTSVTGLFINNSVESKGIETRGEGLNSAYGGAVYNSGTIGDITADFIGNYASSEYWANGGAIYNEAGTIGNITGDFIGNYAYSAGSEHFLSYGGAIYNDNGIIGNITGNFIGNYVYSTCSNESNYGGAIYNGGTIGDITGDFIGNYASANNEPVQGGAIYNDVGTIGNITGDFIGNYVSAGDDPSGGAIHNYEGTIGNITGDFIGNYTLDYSAQGGAITNSIWYDTGTPPTIENITGDFIGNYASGRFANGGAIYNRSGTIGNIAGDFIGNYAFGDYAKAGAIYNDEGTIGDITGNFIGNYASSSVDGNIYGGAIYNENGTIGDISGNFTGNYASSTNHAAYGGAIYNYNSTIGNITGDFISNYVSSIESAVYGGAIYNNNATIGQLDNEGNLTGGIYGSFINNYAKTESDSQLALGGAVYTSSDMNFIADNQTNYFSGNYTEDYRGKINNAIFVRTSSSSSPTIKLQAQNNGVIVFDDQIDGGASVQNAETGKYEIDRTNAYNLALTGDNTGKISLYNDVVNANVTADNVTVDLANGETRDYNFVSMTAGENTKLDVDIDITNQKADKITTTNASSGVITLNVINFIGQYKGVPVTVQILDTQSDALQLALADNIVTIPDAGNSVFSDMIISEAGAIELATTNTTNDSLTIKDKIYDTLAYITGKDTTAQRDFTFRYTSEYELSQDLPTTTAGTLSINGLAVDTPSTINAQGHTMFDLQNETTLNISNVSIEGAKDYAIKAENFAAVVNLTNASFKNTDGTAIQSNVDVNITADGAKSEFTGNTSAIQMNDATKSVNMNAINQGEIVLSDVVDGAQGYNVKLDGDDKSKITVNNNVNNANISLDNTNLYLGRENVFDNSVALSLNSGAMYLNNNAIGTMHVPTLNLNGTTNLSVDVDLQNEVMDRVTADTYNVTEGALLNVTDLNLLTTTDKTSVKILFADEPIANNVEYTGDSPVSYKGTNTVYSPIYRYDVQYGVDSEDKLGYFFFNRAASGSGSNGNISDAYNPSVLASQVATQAGAYTTQLQTFNYAFQHADTFMNIPYLERISIINANKYALSPTADATDVGTFSPLLTKEKDAGFWVKPYASFENIPLKNGPKVSNINYGTLIGYDSPLQTVSHGFERVLTGYIGYNGASQRYSGVDAYQNGGLIGGTATFYKGNFFNATTLSVGATAGDASTMYGSENYTMLLAGIGNKTGYNFEFWNGKVILQPNFLISYTFVNTFDYNNAAGVRIESDPLHAIQLSPGLKLIGNTKNGWQPYIGVNMVWNLLDDSRVTANDVRLPEMSIRPYVQYGVGVQKRFKDKFLAFGQAMIHNGGRNGVALTAGLRWKVGRE